MGVGGGSWRCEWGLGMGIGWSEGGRGVGWGLRRRSGDGDEEGRGWSEATGLQLVIIMQIYVVHTVGTSLHLYIFIQQ